MNISFIGGGNMAQAMIGGLLRQTPTPTLTVAEPDPGKRAGFTAQGVIATADNTQAVAAGEVVVLAIKPQMTATVMPEIAAAWQPEKILVSILAGTTCARLQSFLPPGARVVRAMPNTPLAIGQGMVGICAGSSATAQDVACAEALFSPCAKVLQVSDESRMDAITAISGSGPAYFFRFAEALINAAERLGFTRAEAELLVGQTGAGSWAYLLQQGISRAGDLRRAVTSPGGTTAAALTVIDNRHFDTLWADAIVAAQQRGAELAKM